MKLHSFRDDSWSHLRWGMKLAAAAIALTVAMLLAQDVLPGMQFAQPAPTTVDAWSTPLPASLAPR